MLMVHKESGIMATWKRNLLVLWVGVFFTAASFYMVIPFLPIFFIGIGCT